MTEEVKKNLSVPEDDREQLIVIPDHIEARGASICIRTIDDVGRRVYRGWIDAARPIAEQLRAIATKVIGDLWRVSELAEGSVHALSAEHGEKLGECPTGRIYTDAKWRARDLRVGGYRSRQGLDISLRDHVLASLKEPYNFADAFEDREFMARLEERLEMLGQTEVLKMVRMYRTESEDQIAAAFGVSGKRARNNLAQHLHRGLQRAYKLLKNPGGARAA